MSEHPVVACHAGPDSAGAVRLGAVLAELLGEPLVLAAAYRYDPAALRARAVERDNDRRADAARSALRRARALAGADVEVRERVVPAAGVPDALGVLAREVGACALVLGRDARGHVTRALISHAPCPVVVAPPGRIGRLERIGVAYDGSRAARFALVAATRLAAAARARLVILSAGPTREHARTWLHVARLSVGYRVELELRALAGDAGPALAQASAQLDLLVCGSRGRGGALAALLGSVSAHLVDNARCPVVVVPSSSRGSAGPLGITPARATSTAQTPPSASAASPRAR